MQGRLSEDPDRARHFKLSPVCLSQPSSTQWLWSGSQMSFIHQSQHNDRNVLSFSNKIFITVLNKTIKSYIKLLPLLLLLSSMCISSLSVPLTLDLIAKAWNWVACTASLVVGFIHWTIRLCMDNNSDLIIQNSPTGLNVYSCPSSVYICGSPNPAPTNIMYTWQTS